MNQKNNIVASVDIGTNKTICLIGIENDSNKMQVLGHSIIPSAGVKRGVVLNVAETEEVVKMAIEKASRNIDVTIRKVYVNVEGQQLRTIRRVGKKVIDQGKIVSKADIRQLYDEAKAVQLEASERVYHVVPQSYSIDGETGIRNPIGITGSQLIAEYRLIVGPSSYMSNIDVSIRNAGYEVVRTITSAVAAAEATLSEDEKEAGVAIVDLGAGTTSVAIYYDNVLRFAATVPFGGNVITNDIKEGCQIVLRQAEALKVQYGSALGDFVAENKVVTIPGLNGWEPKEISFKSLSFIIQARMEEIIESFFFQIEKSGFADKLGAGIVLTGGGAKMEGLRQLVRFKTGLDARVGFPIVTLPPDQERVLDSPQYATAFGLLKKALSDSDASNDEIIVKKQKKKERTRSSFSENVVQRLALIFNEDDEDSRM